MLRWGGMIGGYVGRAHGGIRNFRKASRVPTPAIAAFRVLHLDETDSNQFSMLITPRFV